MSVEHVFPQSCIEPPHGAWNAELTAWREHGPNLAQHLHRLGNLTLVTNAANSYLKAKPFSAKKLVFEGQDPNMAHPILSVNQSVYSIPKWTNVEVSTRTTFLASKIMERWPFPM